MTKRKWHTKAIYAVVALAMTVGLLLAPAVVGAEEATATPYMEPTLGVDVKGSVQCFHIRDLGSGVVIKWSVLPGVNSPQVIIEDGGQPGDDYICIASAIPGDAIAKAYIDTDQNGVSDLTISGEKKWGDIARTELDPEEIAGVEVGDALDIDEMVYATIHWGSMDPEDEVELPAGGSLVHWWLVENTDDENQEDLIELLEDIFPGTVEKIDDYWEICGNYEEGVNPFEEIDDWYDAGREADHTQFIEVEGNAADPQVPDTYVNSVSDDHLPGETPGWTQTTIDFFEADAVTGLAEEVMVVTLSEYPLINMFHGENPVCVQITKITPEPKIPPKAQVKTPQVRWAGEKIVLEKDWGVEPGIQDLVVHLNGETGAFEGLEATYVTYIAGYSLEKGCIGNLEAIEDMGAICMDIDLLGDEIKRLLPGPLQGLPAVCVPIGDVASLQFSADQVFTSVDCDGVSQCILSTEQQGQADVNATLYEVSVMVVCSMVEQVWVAEAWLVGPEANHGFLVYFLAFEDIELAEDITPSSSLTGLDAGDDAEVAVQVRGWFTSDALPGTSRVAEDVNGDYVYDLPAGRYVLPDDWAAMAGYNYDLRPNWDLMDAAHLDDIVSPEDVNGDHREELGPYDVDVVTTDPPGEAEWPCIGPFNTLQPWTIVEVWNTSAVVPSSITPGRVRNTVVPDGYIDWYDCPMPQALVIWDIAGGSVDASLSDLDKGDLEGYGYMGDPKIYQSPFYAVEIPSSWWIPFGYNWYSWNIDGPYDYWQDLLIDSIIADTEEDPVDVTDVEVYCDNHGIAGVLVDGCEMEDESVEITATAEYPYTPKKGKYPPIMTEIEIDWGYEIEHLNPDFEATPRFGGAPLSVVFENWTVGGQSPYVKAEWDFNCDGTPETTLTGTHAQVMADVNWTYSFPGVYTVCLTMTDSTPPPLGPLVHTETKIWYVTVTGVANPYDTNGTAGIQKDEAIDALEDYFDELITKAEALAVLQEYFEGA